jgi:undecaprenyl-diphosphatase
VALLGIGVKAWAPGFDLDTVRAVASHRTATLTAIASIATNAGSFALLAPLALVIVLLRRARRPADDLALLAITAGSVVLPVAVKAIVARPRPTISPLSQLLSLSFPSEHATHAAAVYLAIALVIAAGSGRRPISAIVTVIAVLLAIAVALTRVYLGVHYPTDVIGGLLLGWSWALLVFDWARLPLTRSVAGPVTATNGAATI